MHPGSNHPPQTAHVVHGEEEAGSLAEKLAAELGGNAVAPQMRRARPNRLSDHWPYRPPRRCDTLTGGLRQEGIHDTCTTL